MLGQDVLTSSFMVYLKPWAELYIRISLNIEHFEKIGSLATEVAVSPEYLGIT